MSEDNSKPILVSPDIHKALKIRAAKSEESIKKLVSKLLRKELNLEDD